MVTRVEGWTTRLYRRMMNPLILDARRRWFFIGGVIILLLAAVAFVPLKWVRVKMLPFDNKSEFQVIIDMPDGTRWSKRPVWRRRSDGIWHNSQRSRTTRFMRVLRGPTTSTAWCGITSCDRSPIKPTFR